MDRSICIHGHFYQPPRENPWLEAVEIQDSAHPYHDWNERITAECYAPNAASRVLDDEQRITDIISNYARISFNFGPTLLSWLESFAPDVYAAILDADRQSIEWRSGHGSAMAQVYNHIIMPLANSRDRHTQVIWGIQDFTMRFSHMPEGMWLAETAVDPLTRIANPVKEQTTIVSMMKSVSLKPESLGNAMFCLSGSGCDRSTAQAGCVSKTHRVQLPV